MSGEKVCGVNHDRKEFIAVGHSSWGLIDITNMKQTLEVMAPRTQAGVDQFNHHNEQFGIQELVMWPQAVELGYDRRKGFWDK